MFLRWDRNHSIGIEYQGRKSQLPRVLGLRMLDGAAKLRPVELARLCTQSFNKTRTSAAAAAASSGVDDECAYRRLIH